MTSGRCLPSWVPGPARQILARVSAEGVAVRTRSAVRRALRGRRPVILGPWLGEVGFELLYWVPFLRWAIEVSEADPVNLVAVSRGGAAPWYDGIAGRYLDVFDHMSADVFREASAGRVAEVGEQKQTRPTAMDDGILEWARSAAGIPDAAVLHPSVMYAAMFPYWWKHVETTWVSRHARFRTLAPAASAVPAGVPPGTYVAVKFYFNDAFPLTTENEAFAAEFTRHLADRCPVVSLSTGLLLDDHQGPERVDHPSVTSLQDRILPRNNLAIQHAVVAGARAFVGTYGGFAYLAPFCGVPAFGVYARSDGFDRSHLEVAQNAFRTMGGPPLFMVATAEVTPPQLAAMVA